MTFLNTTLLFAFAAIAVPIVMHLIARKEPKKVVFPSVRLLTQRYQTNRSKVRIRRWWLLALRIAAVGVVAFALARPVIAGSLSTTWTTIGILSIVGIFLLAMASFAAGKPKQKAFVWSLLSLAALLLISAIGWGGYTLASGTRPEIDDSNPVALAIVVDNGPLAAWQQGQTSQLDRIRTAARQLVMAINRESRIAVVDRSTTPAAFSLDLAGALSKIDGLQSLEVVGPLESRVEAAVRLLQSSEIASRQIFILSSMPRSSFADDASGQTLSTLVAELGIRVTLWDIGSFEGINRQISSVTLSDNAPAPETTVTVAAVVTLSDSEPLTDENASTDDGREGSQLPSGSSSPALRATAECVLFPGSASLPVVRNGKIVRPDAKPVDRINVQLDRGRDVEVRMTLPPLPAGLHHGAIRLVGEDALAIDDTSYFSIQVLPASPLLLVSNEQEEAGEIAWAVSAPKPVGDPASQYAIEQIGYEDLAASRLTDFDGVILLDPPQNALGETELERYLDFGGSVLVTTGESLGQGEVAAKRWLTFQRRWRVTQPGTFFEISSPSHPALYSLSSLPGGVPFQDFRVQQYWQTTDNAQGKTLMRYAGTGHAALIELASDENSQRTASGRRLVLTTPLPALAPPNQGWNELFSVEDPWPAFALIRDLTRYLTGRSTESWSAQVGTPVSIPLRSIRSTPSESSSDDSTNAADTTRRLQWFPAVGSTPVPIDLAENEEDGQTRSQRILVGQPKHSGVHWIRGAETGLGFTVNVDRENLNIERMDQSSLERMVGEDAFQAIDSLDQMEWTSADETRVVSIWSPLMLLALFVFLLEQILGNRFYRQPHPTSGKSSSQRAAA